MRGLGEWTADWFLARHLARPRAWPRGDLGLRKAVAAFYGDVDVRAARRPPRAVPEPDRPLPAHGPAGGSAHEDPAGDEADEPRSARALGGVRGRVPAPPEDVETWEQEWQDVAADIGGRGAVYLAEDDEGVGRRSRARRRSRGDVWYVVFAYVRPRARRQGVLKALLRELRRGGRGRAGEPGDARRARRQRRSAVAAWRRLGFEDDTYYLRRAARRARARGSAATPAGRRVGARYVQTDDATAVERAVEKYLPRIGRSASTVVAAPQNGWTRVDDELCSRDPQALRRLGRELSDWHGRDRAHARRSRRAPSSATSSGTAAASPTSTSPCRSTTGRCRPATSSRSRPTRPSRSG